MRFLLLRVLHFSERVCLTKFFSKKYWQWIMEIQNISKNEDRTAQLC